MKFMTDAAERGFREAIAAIEKVSAIEIVVAVRPRLRRWLVPHIVLGLLFGAGALAFALWSDYEFDLWSILVVPVGAAIAGGLLVEAIAPLERALLPAELAAANALEAARASFVELGVHHTQGRSGLLVFVSVREQRVVLVGDRGVLDKIGESGLAKRAERLASHIAGGGVAFAHALVAMADEFGAALPRAQHDVNELADMVQTRGATRRKFRGGVR
jgi:putative membrane protein